MQAGRDDDARQARTRQTNRASQQRWRARHKVHTAALHSLLVSEVQRQADRGRA